jgi:hypothetical protein
MQVVLAGLIKRAPNILLIPGTSSLEYLPKNLAARPWSCRRTRRRPSIGSQPAWPPFEDLVRQ